MPQVPTARGIRIRNANDAHLLFYAVHLQRLPMIQRRLDAAERLEVVSGAVFIWEERSSSSSTAPGSSTTKIEPDAGPEGAVISGIERWTDGLKWGPSRVRDDFLFYQEKDPNDRDSGLSPPPTIGHGLYRPSSTSRHPDKLIKQTYSVHYRPEILEGRSPNDHPRKWHLTAYHSPATLDSLADITTVPELRGIVPPEGLFKKARVGKKRDGQSSGSTSQALGAENSSSSPPGIENVARQQPPSYGMTPGNVHPSSGSVGTPQISHLQPNHIHHPSPGYGVTPPTPSYTNGTGAVHGGYSAPHGGYPPASYPQQHQRANSVSSSIGYTETGSQYGTPSHPQGGQGQHFAGIYENGSYRGFHRENGNTTHGNSNSGGYASQTPNGGHAESQDYNPFNGPSPPGVQRRSPGSVPPPPQSNLNQAQHPPPHSQAGYHNGGHDGRTDLHSHPDSYTYSQSPHPTATPQTHPQSNHPLPPQTPQLHTMPHPGMHQRSYSQTSNHGGSEADGGYNRDPEGRALSAPIRGRHGRPSSDDFSYNQSPASSASVGISGRGTGDVRGENGREGRIGSGDSRASHFSPYSRPTNVPGPRQHAAFVSQSAPPSNSVTGFDGYSRDNMFPPPPPPAQPLVPIARVPSIPIPHTHNRHQSNSSSFVSSVPSYLFPPSRTPNSLVGSSSGMVNNGQGGHYVPSPHPPPHPNAASVPSTPYVSNEYNWTSAPPPIASSLQAQSAFPHPAGSVPPSNQSQPALQSHRNISGPTEQSTVMNVGYQSQMAPQSNTPHPNPHQSPEVSHFQPSSTQFGTNINSGTGGGGVIGRVSNSPESVGSNPYYSHPTPLNPQVGVEGIAGVGDMTSAAGIDHRIHAGTPLAINTSISYDATSGSSGPASASVSSKLGPLTPSNHHARDPEDERVLELLSRNTTAGGRTSIDSSTSGSVNGGIAGAGGSVHGEDDVQHIAS